MNSGGWGKNLNRFIWSNNGTYWMRVQPYDPQKTERLTFNLKTRDIGEARRRRDELIAQHGWQFRREAA